ncbi:MAG TPA: response regulator transcription factor [Ktedonobacteraceae bacterium]|jgi:DNA-binding response OmpR family regulator|nr:response regulator transcription factor [Ktedonobacteraceae bacterium]
MRILVVEDHPSLGTSIKEGLENSHYAVDLITNGQDAYVSASTISYDLLILDVMLPGLDGFEICRQLRTHERTMPILFLTARDAVDQRVRGLNLGGDDYLTKPFVFRELEARIRSLLRRQSMTKTTILQFLDITLNLSTRHIQRGDRIVSLSKKEFAIFELLLRHPNEVISRSMILEHCWNMESARTSNVVDFYICSLRTKLCDGGKPDIIRTVRGFGYQLKEPDA